MVLNILHKMKTLTCSDAGFDCATVIKGETEDEIMQKAGDHAQKEHNMKPEDMTPELQQKLRGLIRTA
jgi:predicted small metal-binding protein